MLEPWLTPDDKERITVRTLDGNFEGILVNEKISNDTLFIFLKDKEYYHVIDSDRIVGFQLPRSSIKKIGF